MSRDEILHVLAEKQADLRGFRVKSLSIFGSIARGEAAAGSDVDVLVEFEEPPSFDRYMDLRIFLEDLLGARVDLVTPRSLRPRIRAHVEAEAIRAA